ncbi:hypothetical protein Pcinc_036504 [Petrolisthes cinctipes]|uniref:Uncharacterized protein n=1 Tax=Petrolisthes cinctipes TaxID=88211 RepID=A0AAE1EMH6_PETCI|nr:hypothetical protein Pcinc_036504 [Petrolisthes cinctipes]
MLCYRHLPLPITTSLLYHAVLSSPSPAYHHVTPLSCCVIVTFPCLSPRHTSIMLCYRHLPLPITTSPLYHAVLSSPSPAYHLVTPLSCCAIVTFPCLSPRHPSIMLCYRHLPLPITSLPQQPAKTHRGRLFVYL